MIRRTSCPSSSSAAACSSACSTTAPQNDHENGTTIPTFTVRSLNVDTLAPMRLDGIHHVTCITADAPRNVSFYAGTLGLRLVKKSVNQDDPTVYHLFYADEHGTPGSDITFFEYPGVRRGRPGTGMIHTIRWRVASEDALRFWESRLAPEGVPVTRTEHGVVFEDFEGLRHELVVSGVPDAPLVAEHPEVPKELALQGFDGVRAYSADLEASRRLLEETLGFSS